MTLPHDIARCPGTTHPTCSQCRRREPWRAGFLAQIEDCRRRVSQWPEWMRQERTVPAWMANHATDL